MIGQRFMQTLFRAVQRFSNQPVDMQLEEMPLIAVDSSSRQTSLGLTEDFYLRDWPWTWLN
jgi:hypothetical protein